MLDLKGICVPVCTPFTADGSKVDENAFCKHLDILMDAGIHIVCINGGTGEFPFLTPAEKRRNIEIAGKHLNKRCKIIAHTSCVRTQDTIDDSLHAKDHGADVVMILPPYFEGPNLAGVIWHYEQVAKQVQMPIMAYNIPQCSDFDITPEIFQQLSEIPEVQYIKDSTSIMLRIEDLAAQNAKVFCGCDFLMLYALMTGAQGCFWGGANAMPYEAVQLYDLYTQGKTNEALALWKKMQPLNRLVWSIPFNPAVKEATNLSGSHVGQCRLPVMPLSNDQKQMVKKVYNLVKQ